MCGNSIILRELPELASPVEGKSFSRWAAVGHAACLCLRVCFRGRRKGTLVEPRSAAEITELENRGWL